MADIEIRVKGIKDGTMEDGDIFCTKGSEYDAILCEDEEFFDEYGDDDEKYWYYIKDELTITDKKHYSDWHSMDKEFFEVFFEVI